MLGLKKFHGFMRFPCLLKFDGFFIANEQTEEELKAEIESANVVCLVYAVDDHQSIEKVGC